MEILNQLPKGITFEDLVTFMYENERIMRENEKIIKFTWV
jgi:hypothetical protein